MGAHHCEIQRWSFGCLKTLKSIKVEESRDLATCDRKLQFLEEECITGNAEEKKPKKGKAIFGRENNEYWNDTYTGRGRHLKYSIDSIDR